MKRAIVPTLHHETRALMLTRDTDKKLFLFDAYALIFRAYYAFIRNPRINSKGLNTSAMFGFTNVLLDILKNEKPSHMAVVFDTHEETFREIEYTEYKANRGETPEDIKLAVPYIFRIVKAMNIPLYQVSGYEADDVVGTLAKKAEQHGFITYMMTSDKDYGQLVSDNIFVYRPGYQGSGAEVLGVKEVCEKFGIERVEQVIDILGMMGDAVDNIPGIPGVGEKTAMKFIQEYGSLENLLANTDKLKGKQKENVENNKEQALFSKKLATILLDAPVEFDENALRVEPFNREELEAVFEELEFRTLTKRIFGEGGLSAPEAKQGELFAVEEISVTEKEASTATETANLKRITDVEHVYTLVQTDEQMQQLINELQAADTFCFDTETSDIEPIQASLVGLSFSTQSHTGWYVPVPADADAARALLARFAPLFADASKTLVAQNFKFDYKMLLKYGVHVKNRVFDTMLAHYLINPDGKHGMDFLSTIYLGYEPISIETLIGKKGKSQRSMAELAPADIADYAAEDADVTLQLKHVFDPELDKAEVRNLFDEVEVPLIRVLADMELEGVRLDEGFLKTYSGELEKDIRQLEQEVHALAGETFNVDSPKQLGTILFEKLKITDQIKKTKTGQ